MFQKFYIHVILQYTKDWILPLRIYVKRKFGKQLWKDHIEVILPWHLGNFIFNIFPGLPE